MLRICNLNGKLSEKYQAYFLPGEFSACKAVSLYGQILQQYLPLLLVSVISLL